jgi:hypothetical protein
MGGIRVHQHSNFEAIGGQQRLVDVIGRSKPLGALPCMRLPSVLLASGVRSLNQLPLTGRSASSNLLIDQIGWTFGSERGSAGVTNTQ